MVNIYLIVRLNIMILITFILLLPCILYNVGVGRLFNKYAILSECIINDTYTTKISCSYTCDCGDYCANYDEDGYTCRVICNTCNTLCDEGHLIIYPIIANISNITFFTDDVSVGIVNINDFNNKYQPNDIIECYYYADQQQVKLSKNENMDYYNSYMAFTVIACIFITVWILGEIIYFYVGKGII